MAQLKKDELKYQEEIKARDEFLSIASHELKTPLTSMLLQLQLAIHNIRSVSLAEFSVEKLMKMLEGTEKQISRLSKMINDLLNVSLITTGKLELEREEADLSKILKDVTDRFSARLKKGHIELELNAPDSVIGMFDKLRIEQVVSNLISNAIKYGKNKPLHIKVEQKGQMAVLTVKDQGIGIPSEKLEMIFKRFERAVDHSEFKGLGVGLYITQQIVVAHGGTVTVNSKEGQGSIFVIELPLTPIPSLPEVS